ncbi:hypothetical protein NHU_04431 (plasmid) [Rhodovulum sulfidophilum]|uniref:DNA pilot protein n=1 Tax=Rhodovulum sulfidophilum TaxID=35806 RepID=A0A0D6B9R7_RHOSU|nr:hypothetical protein NHU_04431 [Rhodovulum sulfidophilum]
MNWGAVIGAGASLLGGAMASRSSGKHVVPDYAKIRRKAEAAGFNPLTALTSAPGSAVASQNYMGSAIADAGLILADGMAKKAEKTGELQKAREQNAQLKERVQQLTIRPRVGGIYANNVNTPSIRAAVGGRDENARRSSFGALGAVGHRNGGGSGSDDVDAAGWFPRALEATSPVDPRRKIDNAPVNSTSGFMEVDNPHLPFTLRVPTLDGDEALQWYDYPSLLLPGALAALEGSYKAGGALRDRHRAKGSPIYTLEDGQRYALQPSSKPSLFQRFNTYRKWWER